MIVSTSEQTKDNSLNGKVSELAVANSSSSSTSFFFVISAWEKNTGKGVKLIHEKKYREALDIFLTLLRELDNIGENNIPAEPLGSFYHCLGVCYQGINELFNAQTYVTKAYNIRKKEYGDQHEQTKSSLRRLSEINTLLAKRFIQVPQGRVARFIKGISERFDVSGLCTNTFYNCNIIVFISKDKTKLSLMHADAIGQELVRKEELWAGEGCDKSVVLRKNKDAEENFDDIFEEYDYGKLFTRIEITSDTTEVFAVSISITDCLIKQYNGPYYDKNIVKVKYPIKTILGPIREFNFLSNHISGANEQLREELQFVWMVFDGSFWGQPLENDMRLCKLGALIQQADAKLAITQTQFFRTPGVRIVSILKGVVKEGYQKDELEESQLYKTLEKYNKKASDIENKYFKLKRGLLILIAQHKFSISSIEYNYMIRLALAASSAYQDVCANVKNVLRDIGVRESQDLKQNMFPIMMHINKLLTAFETEANKLASTSQLSSASVSTLNSPNKPKISLEKMQELVIEVNKTLLTSNQIISRVNCPYYLSDDKTPKELVAYKALLVDYRHDSAEIIAKLSVPNPNPFRDDFSFGSFSHVFVGGLVVANFGIGECAECSAILAIKLVRLGYGDLTFVGIVFPQAKDGMERTHQFVVANLHEQPQKPNKEISIYDFFKTLPDDAIIGDPFLGLSFKPKNIPKAFNQYIEAYGKETELIQCFHFINLGDKFLTHYLSAAMEVSKQFIKEASSNEKAFYDLKNKIKTEDNSLIKWLKQKTSLPFFCVRDANYKVDAISEIGSKDAQIVLFKLQGRGGVGRFFNEAKGKRLFVLEGINVHDDCPTTEERVRDYLLHQ